MVESKSVRKVFLTTEMQLGLTSSDPKLPNRSTQSRFILFSKLRINLPRDIFLYIVKVMKYCSG